jgi:hypothetical protein
MHEPPRLEPHEAPDRAQFAHLARQLLRELLEYDAVLARTLWQRGLDLDGLTGPSPLRH